MSDRPLSSAAYDVADAFAANELFQERGWTDGLPVVPPRILTSRFGVREFIRRRKPDSSRPVPPTLLGELSAADAIVSGIGD